MSAKRDTAARQQNVKEQTYESLSERLVEIVSQLERGDLSLADSLRLYEEGMRVADQCQRLLDAAELRIQTLQLAPDGAFE